MQITEISTVKLSKYRIDNMGLRNKEKFLLISYNSQMELHIWRKVYKELCNSQAL